MSLFHLKRFRRYEVDWPVYSFMGFRGANLDRISSFVKMGKNGVERETELL